MNLRLRIDYDGGEAVYQQIADQVKFLVARGELEPGAKLPSIRALASDLKINPRTVVKAYEHLERDQLVVSRQGQGVFIARNRNGVPAKARNKTLREMSRKLLTEACTMGATLDDVRNAIETVGREMGLTEKEDSQQESQDD